MLDVTIVRDGVGAVSVGVHGLPAGVSVAPATIDKGSTAATLTFTAAAGAAQIDTSVLLTASSGAVAKSIPLALRVRGTAGTVDTTFGGGAFRTDIAHENDRAHALAILADGRIVAAGTVFNGGGVYMGLARYLPDGTLDPSFGNGSGRSFNTSFQARGNALAIRSDGRMIVAGGNGNTFITAQYLVDGSLDTTFGSSAGRVTAFAANSEAQAVVLDSAERIVAAGYSGPDFALARWLPSGATDLTFNTTGTLTTDFSGMEDGASSIILEDSQFLVGGSATYAGSMADLALARYSTSGALDATFGSTANGRVATPFSTSSDGIRAIALQSDGKIVAVGEGRNADFLVTRYDSAGAVDTTFAATGTLALDFMTGLDYASAVAIQADGKIVVAGRAQGATNADFAIVRLNADGTLDTTFANGGELIIDFAQGDDEAFDVKIDAEGRIVACGRATNGTTEDFALVRVWN